jgi:hypothetical protein
VTAFHLDDSFRGWGKDNFGGVHCCGRSFSQVKTLNDDHVLPSEKLMVRSEPERYMDTDIVEAWLSETSLTELFRRRKHHRYDGPVISLVDICSSYGRSLWLHASRIG